MPHVQITMLEGRTTEQKRKLAARITEVVHEEIGSATEGISVAFVEVPKDSYARGGVLMLDKNTD